MVFAGRDATGPPQEEFTRETSSGGARVFCIVKKNTKSKNQAPCLVLNRRQKNEASGGKNTKPGSQKNKVRRSEKKPISVVLVPVGFFGPTSC